MSEVVNGAATAVVTISGHVTTRANVTTTATAIAEKATQTPSASDHKGHYKW